MGKARNASALTAGGWLMALLLQSVDGAAADLKRIETQPEVALHRLRVGMKKAGAFLRLGKVGMEKGKLQQLRGRMCRIKDGCAARRDAAVVAKLAADLGKKHGLHFVQAPPCEAAAPKAEWLHNALLRLRRGVKSEAQALDGLTWNDVRDAYAACFKAGRRCMRRAKKTDTAEDYHQWRKQVKRLHFQMAALREVAPHQRKRMQRTQKLGHLLGCDHDLTLLEQGTNAQGPACPWQTVIAKERKRLRARILKLGKKVYQQSPGKFAKLRQLPVRPL